MKKSIIVPISFLFIGLLSLHSCGDKTKAKPTSTKQPVKSETSIREVVKVVEDSLLLAEAKRPQEELDEKRKIAENESYSPPHIPVFKEEGKKTKAKAKKKVVKKKPQNSTSTAQKSKQKADTNNSFPAKKKIIQETVKSNSKNTEIVWRRNFYSFGDITQGDTVYFKFEFTNIGEAPLVIESATASCNCTHPSYSFIPIQPNAKGEIKGMYVSDTKNGSQNAMIQVVTNTEPAIHKLYIDGNVLLPDGNAKDEEKGNE